MLDRFLSAVFDQQYEFNDIWQLKLIKFDTDLDDNMKPYEKHLAISDMVEDSKGNPGLKGFFSLSNLRIVWYSQADKEVNLSIGLDALNNVSVRSVPVGGFSDLKHILTLKAVSPSQTKYQFRFAGRSEREQRLFMRVNQIFKKFAQTKSFRNIDTSIKLTNNSEFKPMQEEQIKTKYLNCIFQQNEHKKEVIIILTNIRMMVLHDKSVGTNYGIPWIMIEGFSKVYNNGREALQVKIRGLLRNIEIRIYCDNRNQFNKMQQEIVSFSETYNKNPFLGVNFAGLEMDSRKMANKGIRDTEVVEIQNTKVNIGRRKNAYGDKNQKGNIRDTFFNEQLGLMMEQMPEEYSRKDFWEILRA